MRKKHIILRAFGGVAVVGFLAAAISLVSLNVSALTESQLEDFAANNIMFYDPGNSSEGGCVSLPDGEGIATVSGTTVEEKLWSGLKSLGLTDEVTGGIMGNMFYEGSLNPARHETSKRNKYWPMDLASNGKISYGLGLIQWSYGRRIRLYNYVKEQAPGLEEKYFNHPEIYSTKPVITGDQFIAKSVEEGAEAEANSLFALELTFLVNVEMAHSKWYSKVFEQTTVERAAAVFAVNVEACGNCKYGSSSVRNRSAKAREIYDKYRGKTSFAGGEGSGGGAGTCGGGESGDDDGEDHDGDGDGDDGDSGGGPDYGHGGYQGDDYTYNGDVASLQQWIKTYAWSTWWEKAGRKKTEQTAAYRNLKGKHGGCNGNDCGGFVAKAIQASGWDPNFRYQGVRYMQETLYNSSTWKEMTSEIKSASDMKPGDIIICSHNAKHQREKCKNSNTGHVMLWAGSISGFADKIASASYSSDCSNSRAPSASSGRRDIMYYINNEGYSIYRKVR